ncbi:MAG TPA: DUF5690 family protein, partial [Saprospiraceae bacterium]|nr:DUF5690 family protein [Saprospiraceae bacterium]
TVWIIFATTVAYFCMYMYRKPFLAATFEGFSFFGLDFKTTLVIAQILGYALSKFIGIRLISSLKDNQRIVYFISLIIISWIALLGFSILPASFGPFCLFINGIPLGMIWGIVFSYIEGRKLTEVFTVFLASNFMVSSGMAKTIGAQFIDNGWSAFQMPFVVGGFVLPLLLLTIWMISAITPPSKEDVALRKERVPMTHIDRKNFFVKEKWFIISIVVIYLILTCIRDIRDSYAVEIWKALGYQGSAAIYTTSETWATFFTLIIIALFYLFRSNILALRWMIIGCLLFIILMLLSITILHLSPLQFMVLNGLALFIPYILLNGILFDRYIAAFSLKGNVGFIMYIADAFGYISSVGVLFYKILNPQLDNWLVFYENITLIGASIIALLLVWIYFYVHFKLNRVQTLNIEAY